MFPSGPVIKCLTFMNELMALGLLITHHCLLSTHHCLLITHHCLHPHHYTPLSSSAFRRGRKIRRYKCPCVYYNNSTAVFHAQLVGDLVFKLNPGPTSSTVRHRNNVTQVHSSRNATISRPSCRQEKRNVNNLSYVKRHGSLRDGKRLLRVNLPNHYVTCGTRSNN